MVLAGGAVCGVADDAGRHGSARLWQMRKGGGLSRNGCWGSLVVPRPKVL